MSVYKNRSRDKGNINSDYIRATQSGNNIVNASKISATNLIPNYPIKTDNLNVLQSTKLEISDTNGLQNSLDSKVDKAGDTMTGDLDLGNNNIDNVFNARINSFQPNSNIDPLSIGFSADNVSFNAINTTFNGLAGQEVAFRITRQGVNYGEIKTEPNIVSISNFNNSAVNLKLEGVNGNLLLDDTNSKLLSNDLDLDLNNNDIINVNDMNSNNVYTGTLECNTFGKNGPGDILLQSDIDVNNNNLKFVNNIDAQDVKTTTLTAYAPFTEIKLNTNTDLNLNGNNIIGIDLINGIQPSGGLYSKVDNNTFPIPPATLPVLPINILSVGQEFGSKIIPANEFKKGSLFSLKIGGSLTCSNNDQFVLTIASNCNNLITAGNFVVGKQYLIVSVGTTNYTLIGSANNDIGTTFTATGVGTGTGTAYELVVFSSQLVQVEGNQTNSYYELEIDFAIRDIGIAGTAQILTNGSFDYFNNTNVNKGYGFNQLNNQTFDTTIQNELCIIYSTNDIDIFTIDIASITKFF